MKKRDTINSVISLYKDKKTSPRNSVKSLDSFKSIMDNSKYGTLLFGKDISKGGRFVKNKKNIFD
jgi:hypothetical protein